MERNWNQAKLAKLFSPFGKRLELQDQSTAHSFRKGAVTVCHSSQKEMTSDLADLMAHKEDTAKRYYRLTEKSKTCVKASQQLHTVMRVNSQKDDSVSKAGSPSRVPWSSVAVDEIRRLFHEEIQGKSLSLKSVKEKIAGSEILKNEDPKRVYDRVRAEWRFPGSDDNTNPSLPTETEEMKDRVDRMFRKRCPHNSDIVPPTSISSKAKALFTEDHVRTLHRLFNDMLGNVPISRNEILKRLSADVEGKE
ncbi:unnamed protein product, partial [Pocillopora meandrina]